MRIELGLNKTGHLAATLRVLHGLSQEEAGQMMSAHRNTIRQIDASACSATLALAFLQALGVTPPDNPRDAAVLVMALTTGKKVRIRSIEFEIE